MLLIWKGSQVDCFSKEKGKRIGSELRVDIHLSRIQIRMKTSGFIIFEFGSDLDVYVIGSDSNFGSEFRGRYSFKLDSDSDEDKRIHHFWIQIRLGCACNRIGFRFGFDRI